MSSQRAAPHLRFQQESRGDPSCLPQVWDFRRLLAPYFKLFWDKLWLSNIWDPHQAIKARQGSVCAATRVPAPPGDTPKQPSEEEGLKQPQISVSPHRKAPGRSWRWIRGTTCWKPHPGLAWGSTGRLSCASPAWPAGAGAKPAGVGDGIKLF